MVFAIGGFNGVTTIFNVECYDSTADEWYFLLDSTDMYSINPTLFVV